MTMRLVNVKSAKYCAFCKYWYDPTNLAIVPIDGRAGFWRFDSEREALCLRALRLKRKSWQVCPKYECKVFY